MTHTTMGDALSQMSGIPRTEMDQIFQHVKENHRRLAECDRHVFTDITPDKPIGKRYRCTACNGEVDGHAYYWFTKGQEQGGH